MSENNEWPPPKPVRDIRWSNSTNPIEDEITELKKKIESLEERLSRLETRDLGVRFGGSNEY